MSRIVTPAEVRVRVALPDDSGINTAIDSAISGALARVQALLPQDSFALEEHTDYFQIDPATCRAINGVYSLRLRNGFVTPESVTVNETDLWVDGTAIDRFLVDREKGIVKIPAQGIGSMYLKVAYESGFEELPEIPTGDEVTPPDWLKEVILTLTALIMTSQQIMDEKAKLSGVVPVLDRQWSTIMDMHLRRCQSCISPVA